MVTKSFQFWLNEKELSRAVNDHQIPEAYISQMAKHLFLHSINDEIPADMVRATLTAILESNKLLLQALEKISCINDIPQELMSELPVNSPKQPLSEQIKTLLTQHPNGLIVPEIASALSVSHPTASRHIRLMEENGIIGRKYSGIGRFRAYYLRGAES